MAEKIYTKNIHGSIVWFCGRQVHREDGPAVTRPDGKTIWFRYNKVHRVDGPAVTNSDGSVEWFLDGELVEYKTEEDWQEKVNMYYIEKVMDE